MSLKMTMSIMDIVIAQHSTSSKFAVRPSGRLKAVL